MSPDFERMHEARRVRFESIDGLDRRDVGLAGEIWLRDICDAKWSTREAMKLAAQLVRYMVAPDARRLAMSQIEHQVQLTRDEIQLAMRTLRLYRAVQAFSVEGDELRAALNLSTLQRLAVLETRYRLEYLMRHFAPAEPRAADASRWVPPSPVGDDPEAQPTEQHEPSAA